MNSYSTVWSSFMSKPQDFDPCDFFTNFHYTLCSSFKNKTILPCSHRNIDKVQSHPLLGILTVRLKRFIFTEMKLSLYSKINTINDTKKIIYLVTYIV